ncbi:MAG: hypothetical protein JSU70_00845 [Phycisphaerales bacterium]|nr:MAG: hypothetical protein JSU70_00845 [Phycisphaerales bacterium]
MQKDFHFYVTYALARKAGCSAPDATTIAWANEYTDRQTKEDIYEVQTQCPKIDRWDDPQIQFTVLVPFHFIPGDDEKWPWKTTRNSPRAQMLTRAAEESQDLYRLGIMLHALQDTFSHEGFSGWREDKNSCYPWYYLKSLIPNVGHAEMLALPDMVDRVWRDPRTNKTVNNRIRALAAAKATFKSLVRARGNNANTTMPPSLERQLRRIFNLQNYDARKRELRKLSGNPKIDYAKTDKRIGKDKKKKAAFVRAASAHLSAAVRTFEGLPRTPPS